MNFKDDLNNLNVEGLEYQAIDQLKLMERITNAKKKRKRILFSLTPIPLVFTAIVLFFVFTPNKNEPIIIDKVFAIERLNANSFTINNYGLLQNFYLVVAAENKSTVPFNNEISYYKDFNKYIDVTNKVDVEAIEVNQLKFLTVKINDKNTIYLEAINDDVSLQISEFDYTFKNIKEELTQLSILLKEYPPVINKKQQDDFILTEYTSNQEYIQVIKEKNPAIVELYQYYISHLNERGYLVHYDANGEPKQVLYEANTCRIIVSETNIDQATIVHIGTQDSIDLNYLQHELKYGESPFLVNQNRMNYYSRGIVTNSSDDEIEYTLSHYLESLDNNGKPTYYLSMMFDFSKYENVKNLTIEVQVNEEPISSAFYIWNGNYLYISPAVLEKKNNSIDASIKFEIKDRTTGKVLSSNMSSFSYQTSN